MTQSKFDKLILSKNERLGLYFLLLLFVGFIILPYKFSQPVNTNDNLHVFINDTTINADSNYEIPNEENENFVTNNTNYSKEIPNETLFAFDPNKLNAESAKQLGISHAVYKRIQNYLNTGAQFKNPEQFSKIYGLSSDQYNTLLPYIKIKKESPLKTNTSLPDVFITIELNNCNAAELLPLPGIGEGLSNRIIKYRNLLGGFHKIEQIKEVYGITDSLYLKIKDHFKLNKPLIKLDLSEMNFDELQKHPYLGYKMAKLISAYVKLHPKATNQEILNNLPANGLEINTSLLPYLNLN